MSAVVVKIAVGRERAYGRIANGPKPNAYEVGIPSASPTTSAR